MIKNKFLLIVSFSSFLIAGEISVSISENLVNDYLQLIGDHEIPKGKNDEQALWSINDPHVKFQEGSAEFFATVSYKKGKTNIKKTITKNMYVEYNFDKNIIQLMIENPVVKMERKQGALGKFDLSSLYQEGLRFQGPRPKTKSIKLKTSKGRVKINMNIKKSIIYFEQGVVRVAIDMNYQ